MVMRESNDLSKLEIHDMFADLKAYEFELEVRSGEESSSSHPTKALTDADADAVIPTVSITAPTISVPEKTSEKINSDDMSLFVKKFSKFMKKNHRTYQNLNRNFKESPSDDVKCFNCGKIGYFISDCPKPKKNDHKKKGLKRNDKKSKRDRKTMIAEQSKSKWADSSSESSDSDSYSSDSDAEEIQRLMADTDSTTTSQEVFDFESNEFTHDDLAKALHDMVDEYSKLS